jgi:hypothetical protein
MVDSGADLETAENARSFEVARYVLYDDTIISVRISTNDNDINNNYKIYMKGQAKGIQVERWKWSCEGVSSVTGRRTVLYKMRLMRHSI